MSLSTNNDNDNVKVAVRCRPFNKREKQLKCKYVIDIDSGSNQIVLKKPSKRNAAKSFRFDYVYGEDSIQKEVYEDTAYPLVESVLEGYNGTIFAYGQTGCGKTWTMEGPNNGNTDLHGIIPSSFQHIFDKVNSDSNPNTKFLIRAGYIEIYNEEIRDLLGNDAKQKVNLREDPEKGVYVQNLTMMTVTNVNDTQHLMDKGRSNRVVGRTNMNAASSRSHAIFVLNVETSSTVLLPSTNGGKDVEETKIKAGKLNLVDLAGSERQSKTGAQGVRFKEATKINLSLSALGNVISALVEGKGKHIPYRDSKLTRLLQDSLGGNTKTVMIACVSPAEDNYDETLSTLRYANRAKNIKNKPKINEDPKDALLKQYQDEIQKLKDMLKNNSNGIQMNPQQKVVTKEIIVNKIKKDKELSEKYDKLKRKYEAQQNKYEAQQNKYEAQQNVYEESKKENEAQQNMVNQKLGEKTQENKIQHDDMMEQIYLLESQLLGGGVRSNNAKKRLDDMKSKRTKRKQQKKRNSSMSEDDNKWKIKCKDAQSEIEDLMSEFEKQRVDLLQDIRMTYREMSLYRNIVYKLMAPSTIDQIIYQSKWDSHQENWILPQFMDNYNQISKVSKKRKVSTSKYNQNLPLSVKKQLDDIHWSKKDSFSMLQDNEEDMMDMMNMSNLNQFEHIEAQNKEKILCKDIDLDHHFMHQINKINRSHAFDANADNKHNLSPKKNINVGHDFMNQLSSINGIQTFKTDIPTKQTFVNEDKVNMMDIANLIIEDKPDFVSPAKSNISEDDDMLSKMMIPNGSPKNNLFQQHKMGKLKERQDGNNEYSVDITELHQLLTQKL